MPKLKNYAAGKRINIWLPSKHVKIAKDIDNLSQFVQMSLEQAAGVMAWDIIKQEKGLQDAPPTPEALERWNKDHPLDPLTAKRKNVKCSTPNSQSKQELW